MVRKRLLAVVVLCALAGAFCVAQEPAAAPAGMDQVQKAAVIKEFGRSAELDGVTLNFILLNNKTIEALFSGAGKYAMRARANTYTTILVQGVPTKDISLNTFFTIEQNGRSFQGNAVNIKNMQNGKVEKGSSIEGLIQLSQKIDVSVPFTVKGEKVSAQFKLSPEALKLLQN